MYTPVCTSYANKPNPINLQTEQKITPQQAVTN